MQLGVVSGNREDENKHVSTELDHLCREPSAMDERMNEHP